jgi:hypothetical protein
MCSQAANMPIPLAPTASEKRRWIKDMARQPVKSIAVAYLAEAPSLSLVTPDLWG